MFTSINTYSAEVAKNEKDLNPLSVLKTAIMLHQKNPKPRQQPTHDKYVKTAPLMQPSHAFFTPRNPPFGEKVDSLKRVLQFASGTEIAALLARNEGNMTQVVHAILDEPSQHGTETCENPKVIDLTSKQVEFVAQMPVEVSELRNILDNVQQESSPLQLS